MIRTRDLKFFNFSPNVWQAPCRYNSHHKDAIQSFGNQIKYYFRIILTFTILFFIIQIGTAKAETNITPSFLSCEGKWSSFIDNIRDLETSGRIILQTDSITLSGLPSFGQSNERYIFTKVEPTIIFFQHPTDTRYSGSLNRLNGNLSLSMQRNSSQFGYIFQGLCKISQRLF